MAIKSVNKLACMLATKKEENRMNMSIRRIILVLIIVQISAMPPRAQRLRMIQDSNEIVHLSEVYIRDVCVLPDSSTQTCYMVGPGFNSMRMYTIKNLKMWQGPKTIFRTSEGIWGDIHVVGIRAPEMHKYKENTISS